MSTFLRLKLYLPWCLFFRYSNKSEELNNAPYDLKEFQKIPLKKKFLEQNPSTSTAFEITDTSIKIKKKKTTHVLKNLWTLYLSHIFICNNNYYLLIIIISIIYWQQIGICN